MDELSAAPVTESLPTSTAETASQVIDAFAATETNGLDVETPETASAETPAVLDIPEPEKEPTEEEKLLQEFGFKQAKKPDGREHYIPRSKVLSMIASGLKRGRDGWTQEKTTLESKAKEYEGYIDQLKAGVAGDPHAFIREIANHDPRYAAFLERQAQPPTPEPIAEMPPPDLPLPDGTRTYSLDGIRKLLEWNAQQVEAKFDAKLKPLTEREQRLEQERRQEQIAQTTRDRNRQALQDAQTWPLFGALAADKSLTPFQQEVFDALKTDRSLDLRGAYMKVALPKLQTSENAMREKLLKELKNTPTQPPATSKGGDAPARAGAVRSTAEIAMQTMRRLEGRA